MTKSRKSGKSGKSASVPQLLTQVLRQGIACQERGDLQGAERLYQQVLAQLPRQADALHLYGMCRYAAGEFSEAETWIRQALQQSVQPLFLYNLSLVLTSAGKLLEAQQCLSQAVQRKPDYWAAWENLAQITWMRGDFIRSYQAFLTLLGQSKNQPNVIYGLFSVLAQIEPNQYSPEREAEFIGYLSYPEANYQQLAKVVIGLLDLKYRQLPQESVEVLIQDPLLLAALPKLCFNSASWEAVLTDLRRTLVLRALQQLQVPDPELPMVLALAQQAFINEYLWFEDANEQQIVRELQNLLESLSRVDQCQLADVAGVLLLLALYRMPADLPQAQWLSQWPLSDWPDAMQPLIQANLFDVLDEQQRALAMPSLTGISDPVSLTVQQQYEVHPYPRWLSIGRCQPVSLARSLRNQFPDWTPPEFLDGRPLTVLVAGCGTGQHVVQIALQYQGARILAIDLSRRSLAYAQRQAEKMQLANVQFMQADILQLALLGQQFDVIESVGVLHHMQDPLKGWQALTALLVPGGLMRIGLYSSLARREILPIRQLIAEQGLAGSNPDIRQLRTRLMGLTVQPGFLSWLDFYSSSGCRDLLFHVQEYQFNLPEIERCLQHLRLDFLGMTGLPPAVMQQFQHSYPSDPYGRQLAHWHVFEQQNPDTFGRMYNFWCQAAPR